MPNLARLGGTELVPGVTAGRLDVYRRLLNVASIAVPVIGWFALRPLNLAGAAVAALLVVVFVAFFVLSLIVGQRATRVMRLEMEAGYSTLLDVADFELRDASTLELLRASEVVPDNPGRRSLVAGLFRVKPGTIVAKRLADEGEEKGG